MTTDFEQELTAILQADAHKTIETASAKELYMATSKAAMNRLYERWQDKAVTGKRVGYFSAEFLVGRLINANLMNMGLLDQTNALLAKHGVDPAVFETIEDEGLGNGGLGRLAACFLDSAATQGIPLDGYGIRYRYGIFRQRFENGFQKETADDWQAFGDPWSVRREDERVTVGFGDQTVTAVPYDTPVIGYGARTINTLRLWQAEAENPFDFEKFNAQKFSTAFRERDRADTITAVLYPNDESDAGKKLRLKQQYFFSSASLQDMMRSYKKRCGNDFTQFADWYAIQLNDTHPVVSIPELIRLLVEKEGLPFNTALTVARATFAYTNHTILPEALEKWNVKLFRAVVPQLYRYVLRLDQALSAELKRRGLEETAEYRIIDDGMIHMARLAIFATHSVNGVAELHTELLKTTVLPQWYTLYPERFNNKTNGITQRRWLALANPELSKLITDTVGNRWMIDLDHLHDLEPYAEDPAFLDRFNAIRHEKKQQLADYAMKREGLHLNREFLLDVQIKRLHEYKRQLLNAFSVLDTYYGIKEGRIHDFVPTLYLFGAKAAPGYYRAKGIIKYINEIAAMISADPSLSSRIQVAFVSNYDVSYAQHIIPAADVSEQISTAGTEASGTSNMKFMLNGAVTLGTYDGANIEIVEKAGEENNYIFGARVEELRRLRESGYSPRERLQNNPRLSRVVNTLIDGTFDDGGTGVFRELYTSLIEGASWHEPDAYFLLHDFDDYQERRLQINRDYRDARAFATKGVHNIANAGYFSSDRTILQYANDIWGV